MRLQTRAGDIFVGSLDNGLPTGRGESRPVTLAIQSNTAGEFVYGAGRKKWDKYVGQFRAGMFEGNGDQ